MPPTFFAPFISCLSPAQRILRHRFFTTTAHGIPANTKSTPFGRYTYGSPGECSSVASHRKRSMPCRTIRSDDGKDPQKQTQKNEDSRLE